ncbi:MAG: MraY family glycosyltransferase, partial [Pirellulaceae bacterium]
LALSIMAYATKHYDAAVVAAAMSGALLAFMRFNFPPASAYLGDAGSMLVGLFIAAIAAMSLNKQAFAFAFIAPIALLAIPMFDTIAAIVRRRLTGRSIYTVDRGHLHHALIRKGFGPRRALLLFFAMCLMTATGGVMTVIYKQPEYAVLSILAVVIFLFVGRVFGFAEYKLITSRSKSILRSFFTMPRIEESSHHASVRLQGERNWDLCWQVLREFAENKHLHNLTMDLNLPWIHESFHANYTKATRKVPPDERWTAEIPLVVNERVIGRIDVESSIHEHSFGEIVAELSEILDSLQPFFIETIDSSLEKESAKTAVSQRVDRLPDPQPPSDPRALDAG